MLGSVLKYPVGFSWEGELGDFFVACCLPELSACFLPAFPSCRSPAFLSITGNQCSHSAAGVLVSQS